MMIPILIQYSTDCFTLAKPDDDDMKNIICEYHRRGVTNKDTISKMLLAEHGVTMRCVVVNSEYGISFDIM